MQHVANANLVLFIALPHQVIFVLGTYHISPLVCSHASLKLIRKNKIQKYSEIEIKVREATSNDKWGASSSMMEEIARATDHQ